LSSHSILIGFLYPAFYFNHHFHFLNSFAVRALTVVCYSNRQWSLKYVQWTNDEDQALLRLYAEDKIQLEL